MSIIAVPSQNPGGLEAGIGAHFGHCEMYTLINVEDDKIKAVDVIPNIPHEQGGCMAPVQYLASKGVTRLIAGGMGLRPLMGFNQMGITVFFGADSQNVGEAVQGLLSGALSEFRQEHTCGGGMM